MADKVTCIQACAAADNRHVSLIAEKGEWGFMMSDANENEASIPTLTMEEVCSHFDKQFDIDILKCDIEGAGKEIFSNCATWINRVRNLIIETHAPYFPHHLMDDLQRNGGDFTVLEEIDIGYDLYVLLLQRA